MAALRLDEFAPDRRDDTLVQHREAVARQVAEAYRDGHAKGFAQGAEASAHEHAEQQDQLRGQFIEAVRDSQMTHQAAQRLVVASLLPVFEKLVTALAPDLAAAGLASGLRRQLASALEMRPKATPRIACAPELASGLTGALAEWEGRYEIETDPRLTPLEARLHWEDGFDVIDLARSLAQMQTIIAGFRSAMQTDAIEKEVKHAG